MANRKINKALRDYFQRMKEVKGGQSAGETSYYDAIAQMMNAIAEALDIDLLCNPQIRSEDGKIPDYGLFSKSRCHADVAPGADPEFGVIEMKYLNEEVRDTAVGRQVGNYLESHGIVVVSNFREFLLLGIDRNGNPWELDFVSLAKSEDEFWKLVGDPTPAARKHADRLAEFVKQLPQGREDISDPEKVAQLLATHARRALGILERTRNGDLQILRTSLEKSLEIKFAGNKQERLFLTTLVQTLFYGLFSAWVNNAGSGKFTWEEARRNIQIPVIRTLFEQLTTGSNLDELNIEKILDHAAGALNRIDRDEFFKNFGDDDTNRRAAAIQHFYENFLAEMDPKMRDEFGVWYTPREIVRYMVERVDHALRMELNCEDGLADKKVYVLDPSCGTGVYVLEVLRKIKEIHEDKGFGKKPVADEVKKAAMDRIIGFEIMAAPLVIAHWQVSDYLEKLGSPIDPSAKRNVDGVEKSERPAIYLTNSLNGWKDKGQPELDLRGMEEEFENARRVKQDLPILVVIGNPPYNSFIKDDGSEPGLTSPYKKDLKKDYDVSQFRSLSDSYVKFIRIAERRIVEGEKSKGVVCYISNFSYLTGECFPVMRKHLMESFDKIWIDSLNGSRHASNFLAPDGTPDPSVFKTDRNPGIETGTAVSLFVRKSDREECDVRFRDLWGERKREDLFESLKSKPFDDLYEVTTPQRWNRYTFSEATEDSGYLAWIAMNEIAGERHIPGVVESRGGALIDLDDGKLRERMKVYFDRSIDWDDFRGRNHEMDGHSYDARKVRDKVHHKKENFKERNLVSFLPAPFDVRWAYHAETSGVWDRNQPRFHLHMRHGDGFLATRRKKKSKFEGFPVIFTRCLGRNTMAIGDSNYFAFRQRPNEVELPDNMKELFDSDELDSMPSPSAANLSKKVRGWLSILDFEDPDATAESGDLPWLHALAITWSPEYLRENHESLENGWPRIPFPANGEAARQSAALGREVMNLLDIERNGKEVSGVTSGTLKRHLRVIGKIDGESLVLTSGKVTPETDGGGQALDTL